MVVTLTPIPDIPMVRPGDDLAGLLIAACDKSVLAPADGDVIVVAQKIVSKAEGRYVDLAAGAEPVLLLPRDPDGSAARLRERLVAHFHTRLGVIVTDSWGRAWRR